MCDEAGSVTHLRLGDNSVKGYFEGGWLLILGPLSLVGRFINYSDSDICALRVHGILVLASEASVVGDNGTVPTCNSIWTI